MKCFLLKDGGIIPVENLSYVQTRQAAAFVDCLGRLIPQEGVDYEVDLTFRGDAVEKVSYEIKPMTDKGAWWKNYVEKLIHKYPPKIENPEPSIIEDNEQSNVNGAFDSNEPEEAHYTQESQVKENSNA